MAKESLREHLNRKLKEKGTTLKAEKDKAKKYKSIAAAKKGGSLYYTDKNGKVMIAAYAEDLKSVDKPSKKVRPKARPETVERVGGMYGDMTVAEKKEVDAANAANRKYEDDRRPFKEVPVVKPPKTKKRQGFDPLGLANPRLKKKSKMNMGGMAKKKVMSYNLGGMVTSQTNNLKTKLNK